MAEAKFSASQLLSHGMKRSSCWFAAAMAEAKFVLLSFLAMDEAELVLVRCSHG